MGTELSPEEEESRKEGIRQQIAEKKGTLSGVNQTITNLERILRKLQKAQSELAGYKKDLKNDVFTPVENYDLFGDSDWAGDKTEQGATILSDVKGKLGGYKGEIGQLEKDIADAIEKTNERLKNLYKQRSSLESEIKGLEAQL